MIEKDMEKQFRCKIGFHKDITIDTFRDCTLCVGDLLTSGTITEYEIGVIKKCLLCGRKKRVIERTERKRERFG